MAITTVEPFGINSSNAYTFGSVTATGNVTGNYFIGNGSQLTGISGGGGSSISNGTSNVTVISSGGNVTVGVGGTPNVVVFATTGEYVTGLISASGNVTGGNLLTGGLISATANVTSGNLITAGLVSVTGNVNIGNATGVTWANASGARAWTYYNNTASSLDTVFL